ncbi:MAG TPA: hypothetical protein VHS97_08455, partial [Isosphaeraceae bacterium]|nr:hypothetical protein [Isosphaeraceae bacterium]
MVLRNLFGSFAWLAMAMAPSIVAADDQRIAEITSLGGRCLRNTDGVVIGVDLSNTWVTDGDLEKIARLTHLESINLAYTKITDSGL